MKIAIISDIHGLAEGFKLAIAQAQNEGYDTLVVLGDLLTYGPEPERTLDLMETLGQRRDVVLIEGNHDRLYFDAAPEAGRYYDGLPAWLRESIDWTRSRIGTPGLDVRMDWHREWVVDATLLSHANPFGALDWTYLRTEVDLVRAAETVAARGLGNAVFGHTHRVRQLDHGGVRVATVGSVGQPRDRDDRRSQWAMLSINRGVMQVEPRHLPVDLGRVADHIRATEMSAVTKQHIIGYLASE